MSASPVFARLVQTPEGRWIRWLEVIVLSAAIPSVGFLLNGQDPFFLRSGFPWPVIAPALIALRYGIGLGGASALGIIVAAAFVASPNGLLDGAPIELSLAALLSALICGQFRDSWDRTRARYEIERAYQSSRIEQITHSYGILLASHSKLEERLCGEAVSLRSALTAVRERLMVSSLGDADVAPRLAETILDLFAEYGHVQVSAVYRCLLRAQDPLEFAQLDRLAERGGPAVLSPDNPLLWKVLHSDKTAIAAPHQLVVTGGFQAMAPIRQGDGRIWGVVCVGEMGTLDYSHRTFELLTLIADYISDGLCLDAVSEQTMAEGGQVMGSLIDRWCHNAGRYGLGASLLVLQGENGLRLRAVGEVLRARSRALDHVWLWEGETGRRLVLALLPLTSVASARILMRRVEEELLDRGGISFERAGIEVEALALRGDDSAAAILRRLERPVPFIGARAGLLSVAPHAEG